jgi:hypothetical protein
MSSDDQIDAISDSSHSDPTTISISGPQIDHPSEEIVYLGWLLSFFYPLQNSSYIHSIRPWNRNKRYIFSV